MKSIFYIGAALMVGAGIYGFADYKKASANKEFKSLYDSRTSEGTTEKEVRGSDPRSTVGNTETERQPVLIKDEPMKANNATVFASASKEEIKSVAKTETKKQMTKKRKKLNYKSFSRAAMRDYEEVRIIPDVPGITPDNTKAEVAVDKKEQ